MSSSLGCQTALGAEAAAETQRTSDGEQQTASSETENPPQTESAFERRVFGRTLDGSSFWSPCAPKSCRCDLPAAGMVWSRDGGAERPPLSAILPRLYLGAESDVTQEQLASRGISYVLSVSRCSPQPSFLPGSRYLRVPIDDSLWDDLLPWIPQALRFIDAAMSSGASVLVHCAAGISRSPALAVAYIMYSLGLDLDRAYRFVKERRPSISPNFNFLGQLQHFQATLSQKACGGDLLIQLDNRLPSEDQPAPSGQSVDHPADGVLADHTFHHTLRKPLQRHPFPGVTGNQSGKLQTLQLNLSPNQQQLPMPCELPAPVCREPVEPVAKPAPLPAGSASLREKRKSLTLCLSSPSPVSSGHRAQGDAGSQTVHSSQGAEARTCSQRAEQTPREQSSEREGKEQGLLSPLGFTLNKLLGWGERLLMGGVFVPVRMGQPALPYSC